MADGDGTSIIFASGAAALLFASVHLLSPKLVFLDRVPRSRSLSAAGGVSTAYVFVHLLPELAHHQFGEAARFWQAETEIFVVALLGLTTFYGLERMVKLRPGADDEASALPAGAFWIHIASFSIYNLLICYLLPEQAEEGPRALALYALAMSVHFIVNDRGLYAHHGPRYLREGRWLLAAASITGWAAHLVLDIGELWVVLLLAFLGGGVVLNVLKEELPDERQSRFSAFAGGALGYTVLLHLG